MTTPSISAVVTICSSRKKVPVQITATSLSSATQGDLVVAWLKTVRAAAAHTPAADVYGGRGFSLAKTAAQDAGAGLFVISAGLGLIRGDAKIPAYALTIAEGPESVAGKVQGRLDPVQWFRAVNSGPFASPWSDVLAHESGCILVALTRPYAKMVGPELAALDEQARARLRLFGVGIAEHLPVSLRPAIMPYDDRLDAITPGTKADFAQRALADFAKHIALSSPNANNAWHADAVRARIKDTAPPPRPDRPRRSDDEVEALIRARLRKDRGIQRLLRALRDEDGVACEQARFRRIYWKASKAEGLQ